MKASLVHDFSMLVQRTLRVLYLAVSLDEKEEGWWKTFSRISDDPEDPFTSGIVWDAVTEEFWRTATVG